MQTRNNFEKLQIDLIEDDNVNVGKISDLHNFFILIGGIIGIIIVCSLLSGIISDIFISHMSDETQMKIENLIKFNSDDEYNNNELKDIKRLNNIKLKIIQTDNSLKNKSKFPITILSDKEVNACIIPNGRIMVTKGTLEQNYNDEELTFILAHEIGHYAHRDHLKAISRQILMGLVYITISGQTNSFNEFLNGITDLDSLAYSRKQEKEADKYAGEALIKIYGNNNGGKSFILKIKSKDNTPDFVQYISTHPNWNERLKILNRQNAYK